MKEATYRRFDPDDMPETGVRIQFIDIYGRKHTGFLYSKENDCYWYDSNTKCEYLSDRILGWCKK